MASNFASSLALSLLLFTVAVHCCEPYCPGTPAAPTPPTPATPVGCEPYCPGTPAAPTPPTPATPVGCEPYCPGTPAVQTPPTPATPVVPSPYHEHAVCSINALKLRVCATVLGSDVLGVKIGEPEHEKCCPLLEKLVDLDAAVCLCAAVRAKVLGVDLAVPVDIKLILNRCGKHCPSGFACPA